MRIAPLAIVTAMAAALAVARDRWVVVRVVGHSMSPTYADGDRLVVRRTGRSAYRTGDCVAFVPPAGGSPVIGRVTDPEWLVKRVAAVAGDPVPPDVRDAVGMSDPVVPSGCLVVYGDNHPVALDSRHFGYLRTANVVGVVSGCPRRRRVRRLCTAVAVQPDDAGT